MSRILILVCGLSLLLRGQQAPAFDVASVTPEPWGGNYRVGVFVSGNTLTAEHTCLYGLVEYAYNLRDEHLSGGPAWAKCGVLANSDLYLVVGKAPGGPTPTTEQFRLMLRTLLAERFQLVIRHAPKQLPTYDLVLAARGLKMKESAPDTKFTLNIDARLNHGKSHRITATHASMEQLLSYFEQYAGRPLFDKTGLSGFYDFELSFDSENVDGTETEAVGQTFPGATEKQLGLRLVAGTAPFDTVVIESASKPSAN